MQERFFKMKFSNIDLSTVWYDNKFNFYDSSKETLGESKLSTAHVHRSYEVFFVTEGKLWLITEKEQFICENSVLIIPPNMNHYTLTENAVISTIDFIVERHGESSKKGMYEKFIEKSSNSPIILPIDSDIAYVISRISRELNFSSINHYILQQLMSLLFSDIFRRIIPEESHTSKKSSKHYSIKITDFMAENYKKKISLKDMANALFLSEKQTSRIIHKGHGCSFNEFIMRWRLNVACMYLNHTSLEICEIASLVGYEYTSLFFSHFKKTYGMTPTKYRLDTKKD